MADETSFVLGEPEFGRFTRPAAEADAAVLEAAIDLGNALTTARREHDAVALLAPVVAAARHDDVAPDALGWAVLTLGTAEQYAGVTTAAEHLDEALAIARRIGDAELEHYALHHLGRFLVDAGRIDEARAAFASCLDIRRRLDEPRAASTEAALAALAGA